MTLARLHATIQEILLLIIQLAVVFSASPAYAATFSVNTTADPALTASMCTGSNACSLRAAVRAANSTAETPDTITLPAGTYALTLTGANEDAAATGDLDITSPVTISGAGSTSTVIDGNTSDRVFHVLSGGNLTLNDVTVQNGSAPAGQGGGIYNQGGTFTLDQATISNNTSSDGGGLYNTGTMELRNCVVSSNTADTSSNAGGGGGISNTGLLTISNCTFDGNQSLNSSGSGGATPGGGALQNVGNGGIGSSVATTNIHGSTFTNNSSALGGAIRNLFGAVNMDTTLLDGNTADFEGGSIENTGDSTTNILTSTISNSIARQNGGGINNLGDMKITNSAIYGNSVPGIDANTGGAGGGVFNGGNGVLTVVSTTISGNSARVGGGLFNHREAALTNATLYDNAASSTNASPNGSQVYACGDDTNCSSGITNASNAQIIHTKFVNSIIGNSNGDPNCGGDVTDLISDAKNRPSETNGHNIETGNTCGLDQVNKQDLINVPPAALFNSALAFNGGDIPSLLTYSLPPGSPAHDAADSSQCPATDERSFKRFETTGDGCDIGAYEISTTPATSVLDLALDIQYRNASPLNGTVESDITFTVSNTSSVSASNLVLTVKVPTLSWLTVSSLRADSSGGSCSRTTDGVICTLPSLAPFATSNFFVATTASQAGAFSVDGNVVSDGTDNFRPDNQKSVTITIPTVTGNSGGGNNFGGSSGGGAADLLSLGPLLLLGLHRARRR